MTKGRNAAAGRIVADALKAARVDEVAALRERVARLERELAELTWRVLGKAASDE